MSLLNAGDILRTDLSGQTCVVKKLLGGGGQGEVYLASLDGRAVAVKWYFSSWLAHDVHLLRRLTRAIEKGAPSDRFLWPEQLVRKQGTDGFGYVMPLREERFKGLVDLIMGRVSATGFVLSTVGFELAQGFSSLHSAGMCYQDISFGNVFFDPTTGEVRICDNDNVDFDGEDSAGVGGTPKFIAPEIVQGVAHPNIRTDQHSLAVLLFYMFHFHHPLEGKRCMRIRDDSTEKAQDLLYGSQALFIFDPDNTENAAVTNAIDPEGLSGHNAILNWNVYPEYLKNRFTSAFTGGLHDPYNRVRETEWKTVLMELRDGIYACSCGTEIFYDAEKVRASGGAPQTCYQCGAKTILPPRMGIQRGAYRSIVLMTPGRRLFPLHIDSSRHSDLSTPVAEVIARPDQPGVLGLKNLSANVWSATLADGAARTIEPNKIIPLSDDLRIQFNTAEARLKM
ncbi:MAG: serine/threonine protein kinase [Chthonomonadaceae bacterium]|nr:serine/threonine protein kinase [Chthonomonadaceae bacterium]